MKTSQKNENSGHIQDAKMLGKQQLRRCSSCNGLDAMPFGYYSQETCKGWKGWGYCRTRKKLESTKSLPRNQVFWGKIETGRLLGSGGFGSVYEGNCLGKHVAVKRMHRMFRKPRAMFESLQSEKLVLELQHPNIVRTLAVVESESLTDVLIIMEFAGERNLQSLIVDERESLCCKRRVKFATDITRALKVIHERNLVHLDLKPSNVIVDSSDTCKLGDFGCCQLVHPGNCEQESFPPSPTQSPSSRSSLTGTYAYRAPELLKGEEPSTKADMYSLGICLWQMLTREQPYGLESQFVVIFGVVANQMRPSLSHLQVETTHDEATCAYVELMTGLWSAERDNRPSANQTMEKLQHIRTLSRNASRISCVKR